METQQPPKPTLLSLPTELRLRIYEYTVLQSSLICINRGWLEPALVRAFAPNSNDRTEITKIFFGRNTFIYYLSAFHFDRPDFEDFLGLFQQLDEERRGYLHRVDVVCFWATKQFNVQQAIGVIRQLFQNDGIGVEVGGGDGGAVVRVMERDERWRNVWFG